LHGGRAESAVSHGPLQRRQHVAARIRRRQRQDTLGLALAEPAAREEALQEPRARRAEFGEVRRELLAAPLGVARWLVLLATAPLARDGFWTVVRPNST
jgi:hypothetical protein